jgi:hypothetical protein
MQQYLLAAAGFCLSLGVSAQSLVMGWSGRFGGVGEDVVRELYVDPAGNSYTTGYFTDNADFDISPLQQSMLTSNGFFDIFVQKTSPDGELIWAKGFGGTGGDLGTAVVTDANGNVYVTGAFEGNIDFDPGPGTATVSSHGMQDIFLLKLDPNGNFLWAGGIGGVDYEESVGLGVDATGNVYLSAYFSAPIDADPGSGEVELTSQGVLDNFVAKFNSNGELIWANSYGGSGLEVVLALRVTPNGDQYITGSFSDPGVGVSNMTGSGNSTGYLLKLDTDGNFELARSIGASGNVTSYDLDVDTDGNMYLTGQFSGTIDLDPGIGITQFTSNLDNGFVIKLDASGDFVWGNNIRSAETVIPYSIDVNSNGDVMISGYMETTTDFNPDPVDEFNLSISSENATSAFISILDDHGSFVTAFEYGGCDFLDYHGAYTDADDNIYISGAFETTVDIDPVSTTTSEVASMAYRDSYLIKMQMGSASVSDLGDENSFSLFPNPAVNSTQIKVTVGLVGESYTICDQTGRTVMTGKITAEEMTLNLSDLSKGVYQMRLSGGQSHPFVLN